MTGEKPPRPEMLLATQAERGAGLCPREFCSATALSSTLALLRSPSDQKRLENRAIPTF